ncbi:concanavalin A-like lectin/glucanase domain-containing protein, partial [Roridomyces roridus]
DDHDLYYAFWAPDGANVTITNYNYYYYGEYTIQWGENSDFLGGKGWQVGSTEPLQFSTNRLFTGNGSSLVLYGTSTDPAVEYFIAEDVGPLTAARLAAQPVAGTLTADGSLYNIYQTTSQAGSTQYWNVRQTPRGGDTLTVATHFAAWEDLGMPLGTLGAQLVAVK